VRTEAFHGLSGHVVGELAPYTEADSAGLLLSLLAGIGTAIGCGPHLSVDASIHPARLNVVLVGRTARARKGTSWSVVKNLLNHAIDDFPSHVIGGLASGEGLVADLSRRQPDYRSVLIVEPEFARLLRVGARSASLSALIREAWDSDQLTVLTRHEPLRAVGVNVAILGHVTADELRRRLDATEIANGMANRFLFCWVERAQRLPNGASPPTSLLADLVHRLRDMIEQAGNLGQLHRTPAAAARWAEIYDNIDDTVDGVIGSLCARAEAQMVRLSVVYAAIDGSPVIDVCHVEAAKAVWDHCHTSIELIFAATNPNEHVTNRLLGALRAAGPEGLDRTEQRDLFSRHLNGRVLDDARRALVNRRLAYTYNIATAGRPRLVTVAAESDLSSLPSPPRSQPILTSDNGCVSEPSDD
jgi:hypothetical protein